MVSGWKVFSFDTTFSQSHGCRSKNLHHLCAKGLMPRAGFEPARYQIFSLAPSQARRPRHNTILEIIV